MAAVSLGVAGGGALPGNGVVEVSESTKKGHPLRSAETLGLTAIQVQLGLSSFMLLPISRRINSVGSGREREKRNLFRRMELLRDSSNLGLT